MTLPNSGSTMTETTESDLWREQDEAIADHFRHIVCLMCYPAFAGEPTAPHDAECICGKPMRAGESPGSDHAPQCVLCYETAENHYRKTHAKR